MHEAPQPRKVPPSPRISRNPFEVWLMVSFVAWAAGIAFFGPPAAGVILTLPDWVRYLVAFFIALGAAIALVGIYTRDIISAAFLEFAGLVGISGPLFLYVANIVQNVVDWQSGLGACALAFLLLCCVHRCWDAFRWIRFVYRSGDYERGQPPPVLDDPS